MSCYSDLVVVDVCNRRAGQRVCAYDTVRAYDSELGKYGTRGTYMLMLKCHRYLAAYICRLNCPRPPWDLGEVFSLLSKMVVMKVLVEPAQPQYPAHFNRSQEPLRSSHRRCGRTDARFQVNTFKMESNGRVGIYQVDRSGRMPRPWLLLLVHQGQLSFRPSHALSLDR